MALYITRTCKKCGVQQQEGETWWGSTCPACRSTRLQKVMANRRAKRLVLKKKYVEEKGGACTHCGYNRYWSGLTFHHVEDKEENVGWWLDKAVHSGNKWIPNLEGELAKCILLCFNCHMALHAGEWEMEEMA